MLLKLSRQFFVVTLPLAALPILTACISGVLFSIWDYRNVRLVTQQFMLEVKDISLDWGTPGVPTRREYHDAKNNFHIARVNGLDWFRKLGFLLPKRYFDVDSRNTPPIDKYADLEHLMRDPDCAFPESHNGQTWLYLTDDARPSCNEWDAAFDTVLQKCYTQSCGAVAFVNCNTTGAFLCGVWKTRAPALVHFHDEVEPVTNADIGFGLSYDAELEDLRRITVRVIEFPLKDAFIATSLRTFPSPTEQMTAVVLQASMYEQFPPYSLGEQLLNKRFTEYMNTLWEDRDSTFHQIKNLDDWMWDHVIYPLGLKTPIQIIFSIVFPLAALPGKIVLETWRAVDFLWGKYTGRERPGDAIMGDPNDPSQKSAYFEGLIDEVWTASLSRKLESESISMSKHLQSFFARMAASSTEAELAHETGSSLQDEDIQ